MQYIVMDMEWNQPWPSSPSSKKVLPVKIRGEIIQIGAVRVTEDQQVADEFQIMIKPKYYRHLNRRVSKLTGIKESRLRDEGVPFAEAMEQFRGQHRILLTYSPDHGQHATTNIAEEAQVEGVNTSSFVGMHGSKMIEDMNIMHFFGTI